MNGEYKLGKREIHVGTKTPLKRKCIKRRKGRS